MPSSSVLAYARRVVRRQFGALPEDAEDIVADALLDYVRAARRGTPCSDGLFLVIVRRRACDFWRSRPKELPLGAAATVTCGPDQDALVERALRDRLVRASPERRRLDRRRLLGVTSGILAGETFAEACRACGIPRGSQERYRRTLQALLRTGVPRGAAGPGKREKIPKPQRGFSVSLL